MDTITNKFKSIFNTIQNKALTTWNFKTTLCWGFISFGFIVINVLFFLLAISLRNNDCLDISFDLSEFLLMSTGITLAMILGSWMVNYVGGLGFWSSLINFIYHNLFIGWLILSAIIGILLITFSNTDCTDTPKVIFIIVPLYLIVHNMIGGIFMSVYCAALLIESWRLYQNRHYILDDLIV